MGDSTCSVCLEPLLSKNGQEIGATVPCGHCFHPECFGAWRASKGPYCKCPNCNVVTTNFVKIFIGQGNTAGYNDDDDDISLNSTDSEHSDEDEDDDHDDDDDDDNNTQSNSPSSSNEENRGIDELDNALRNPKNDDNGSDSDDCQVIEPPTSIVAAAAAAPAPATTPSDTDMVDLTLSPPPDPPQNKSALRQASAGSSNTSPTSSSSSSNSSRRRRNQNKKQKAKSSATGKLKASGDYDGDSCDETKRLKSIARRYKLRWKQQQSLLREGVEQQRVLREQLSIAKQDLAAAQEDYEELTMSQTGQMLRMQGLELRVVLLNNERDRLEEQYDSCKKALESTRDQFTKLRADYKRDLDKARLESMAEVQRLLEQHPKLVQENRDLKDKLKRYQRDEPNGRNTDNGQNKKQAANEMQSVKSSRNNMVKALRGMDNARQIKGGGNISAAAASSSSNATAERPKTRVDVTKYSAHATRLAKAAAPRNKSKSSSTPASSILWEGTDREPGGGGGNEDILPAAAAPARRPASALQRTDSTSSRTNSSSSVGFAGFPLRGGKPVSDAVASRKRKLVEKPESPAARGVPDFFGRRRAKQSLFFRRR